MLKDYLIILILFIYFIFFIFWLTWLHKSLKSNTNKRNKYVYNITGFVFTTYVMSFLGMDPKNHAPICRPGIEAIMKAVQKSEGKQKPKIMIMSSIVLLDSYAQGKAAWGCCGCIGSFMRWKFLRLVFDDMEAAEQYAIENRSTMGLDVCLLRATVLGDKSNYYLDYTTTEPKSGQSLPKKVKK